MFCSNCGKQIEENIKFCPHCGVETGFFEAEINDAQPPSTPPASATPEIVYIERPNDFSNKRLRHGFTSFYLWLMFIFNIAGVLIFLANFFVFDGEIFAEIMPDATSLTMWIFTISLAVSLYAMKELIFDWRKSGFYLTVGVSIFTIFFNPMKIYGEDLFIQIIGQAVPLGILFGVLQFKNAFNAKSTWEQLSG